MKPFDVHCPHCRRRRIISNPAMIGATIECLACEMAYKVERVEAVSAVSLPNSQTTDGQAETRPCPSCGTGLHPQAVLCVQCGLDLETGRTRKTIREDLRPNIARERDWLVVPIGGAVFPNRCVKTNEPVEEADFEFVADFVDLNPGLTESPEEMAANIAARLLFGRVGPGLVRLAQKERLEFEIGLSDELQRRSRWRWRVGLGLVIAGPLIGLTLCMIALSIVVPSPSTAMTIALATMVPGMIAMIIGLILFGMSSMTLLRVAHSDGRHVWLSGAHPAYLAALPESKKKWKPPLADRHGGE